jgi:hypothetical protein
VLCRRVLPVPSRPPKVISKLANPLAVLKAVTVGARAEKPVWLESRLVT